MTSSSSSEDWTENKCIQLISEFRKRPLLWDKTDVHYYRKEAKWEAWEEIAKLLNVTADCCRHKMGILLSSFRREKSKMVHSLKSGDVSKIYRSIWFGWPHLLFLIENRTRRQRQCQQNSENYDAHEIILQIMSNEDHEDDEENEKSSDESVSQPVTPPPTKPQKKRNAVHEDNEPNVVKKQARMSATPSTSDGTSRQSHTSQVQVTCQSTNDEELKFFTAFLASKMKKYSEGTKNAVQQAICNILFKADRDMLSEKYETHEDEPNEDLSDELIETEDIKVCYSDSE